MDGWGEIMQAATAQQPLAWVYFVCFVVISGFIVASLFIADIINSLEEIMQERRRPQPSQTPATREETLRELRPARQTLDRLEIHLNRLPD